MLVKRSGGDIFEAARSATWDEAWKLIHRLDNSKLYALASSMPFPGEATMRTRDTNVLHRACEAVIVAISEAIRRRFPRLRAREIRTRAACRAM